MKLNLIEATQLTRDEQAALVCDVHSIVNDERRTWDDAQKILLSRIGGPKNLQSYVDCLMVEWRKLNAPQSRSTLESAERAWSRKGGE